MKVKSAIRKMCEHCFVVKQGKKIYIKCKADPRHKQRQGRKQNFSTFYNVNVSENSMVNQKMKEILSENTVDKIYLDSKLFNPLQTFTKDLLNKLI